MLIGYLLQWRILYQSRPSTILTTIDCYKSYYLFLNLTISSFIRRTLPNSRIYWIFEKFNSERGNRAESCVRRSITVSLFQYHFHYHWNINILNSQPQTSNHETTLNIVKQISKPTAIEIKSSTTKNILNINKKKNPNFWAL